LIGLSWAGLAEAAEAQPPPGAACVTEPGRCFVLLSLTVDGVTAYPLRDLAPLYADYLARPISDADLVRIAQAITDKYRQDGYFLSRAVVPPQGPAPGHAHLRVYEGRLADVAVTGDAAPALRTLLAGLTERRPLRLADLDRRLTLANDLPGVKVHTAIEPIVDDPAAHRLVVDARLQPLTASVSVDNRGAETAGPDQVFARVGVNSLFQSGDQLAVAALTAPSAPGEIAYGELSYAASLAGGSRLRAAVSAARSRQGVNLRDDPAGTENEGLSLRLAHPLSRGRRHGLWAAVAFDARHVEQVYMNGASYADELRVVRASLQASQTAGNGSSNLFVQVSRGLGALGASKAAGVGRSRFDADGQFWKVNAAVSHYRDLGAHAGLYLSADAQWAPHALLLSEEFAPGGLPYGRAYNYAEISGDSGVAGLAEFRVGWDPKLKPLTFFQTYAFVDAAKVWNTRSAFGQLSGDITSGGAGVRLTFGDRLVLRAEAAKPLGPRPWETGSRKWRAFVSLWAGF
jgi:hemolysin activation/secretion protein